jgi:predicted CXXCH cytochrome family protein
LFDGSKHKQAFDKHGWPECGMCHGNHAITKTNDAMLSTAKGGLCGDCHREFSKDNPDCIATAEHFHKTITEIEGAREKAAANAEKLAAKGLDVEQINNQLTEMTDGLRKSRTHIHSFSRDTFQQVAAPAIQAAQNTEGLVAKARGEYKLRQFWLALSIGIIGVLMLTLYLKLRRLEKDEQ